MEDTAHVINSIKGLMWVNKHQIISLSHSCNSLVILSWALLTDINPNNLLIKILWMGQCVCFNCICTEWVRHQSWSNNNSKSGARLFLSKDTTMYESDLLHHWVESLSSSINVKIVNVFPCWLQCLFLNHSWANLSSFSIIRSHHYCVWVRFFWPYINMVLSSKPLYNLPQNIAWL